jgi:hypothetical protein
MGQRGPVSRQQGVGVALARSLPPGWLLLASAPDAPCHVLGHPAQGVILLDLATAGTAGVEARLGRTMRQAGLHGAAGSATPAWYLRIEADQIASCARLLADALAAHPAPATVPPDWLPRLEAGLRRDPAWSRQPRLPLPAWSPRLARMAAVVVVVLLGAAAWQGARFAAPMADTPDLAEVRNTPDSAAAGAERRSAPGP